LPAGTRVTGNARRRHQQHHGTPANAVEIDLTQANSATALYSNGNWSTGAR
jgi:hypothetical protein